MNSAIIAILLGLAAVATTLTTTAAPSKNNPAIEACLNKSSTNLNMQRAAEMGQNIGNPSGMMNGQPFNANHTLLTAIQQALVRCLIQYNK